MPKDNSSRIQSYRDLDVWQIAMDLVVEVYQLSKAFPADERFGLTAQVRKAVVSIPTNVAEGHARTGVGEYSHFVSIARGSTAEVETELLIAERLDYVGRDKIAATLDKTDHISRMLTNLRRSLK
jgi:four helix bundle protein